MPAYYVYIYTATGWGNKLTGGGRGNFRQVPAYYVYILLQAGVIN